MKKLFCLLLCLLLPLSALAESQPAESAWELPIALPESTTALPTQWRTVKEGYAPPTLEAAVDPATNCFVVTLRGLTPWGIAPEALAAYALNTGTGEWEREAAAENVLDASQALDLVTLSIDAEYYYMNGLPAWETACAPIDGRIVVEDYSGDPNNPGYFLTLYFPNGYAVLSLNDGGASLCHMTDSDMAYCVYGQDGTLQMGTYLLETEAGDLHSYAVVPTQQEAITGEESAEAPEEPYMLYYIHVSTADGHDYLYTDGQWSDIEGNPVAAPEGVSESDLPFSLI
ncbi:MAG: hypothetical protein E7320_09850 [Clostridiales bacterium]|nr:hypothetical protein [Clostridiales bacterium]